MTFLEEMGNPGFQIDVFTHVAGQLQPLKKKKKTLEGEKLSSSKRSSRASLSFSNPDLSSFY